MRCAFLNGSTAFVKEHLQLFRDVSELLENLDRIPNEDNWTKVAIIVFDVALYFFSMPVCVFLIFFGRRTGTDVE